MCVCVCVCVCGAFKRMGYVAGGQRRQVPLFEDWRPGSGRRPQKLLVSVLSLKTQLFQSTLVKIPQS